MLGQMNQDCQGMRLEQGAEGFLSLGLGPGGTLRVCFVLGRWPLALTKSEAFSSLSTGPGGSRWETNFPIPKV